MHSSSLLVREEVQMAGIVRYGRLTRAAMGAGNSERAAAINAFQPASSHSVPVLEATTGAM